MKDHVLGLALCAVASLISHSPVHSFVVRPSLLPSTAFRWTSSLQSSTFSSDIQRASAANNNYNDDDGMPTAPPELWNSDNPLPADKQLTKETWDQLTPSLVQGNSLKTFKVDVDRIQLLLKTDGRPLQSKVELWHGPDYTPTTLEIYLENGNLYPFNAVLETPYSNTVAVFNTGNLEFPMSTCVVPEVNNGLKEVKDRLVDTSYTKGTIQGGALKTYNFDPNVASVQVYLQTDGRHLIARLELLHGPNNNKQIIEIYSSDGKKRSFFAVFETPEAGCVFRIVNKCTVEYPLTAMVEPYSMDKSMSATDPVLGGN